MITEPSILALHKSEFSWIRCEGKGSFQNSSALKAWCESEIKNGAKCLVVDLQACKGMDSTFMGTLAGLAMRLMKIPQGRLQVAEASDKNRSSLEGLGLESLIDLDPQGAVWQSQIEEIRNSLTPCELSLGHGDSGSNVLEAHKKLCEADSRNNEKFAEVLSCLEAELERKKIRK